MSDRTSTRRTRVMVPAVIAGVAALVAAALAVGPTAGGEPESADRAPVTGVRSDPAAPVPSDDPLMAVIRRDEGDPLALGEADAPVVMVSYSEFQCPFCGKFARDTEPLLVDEYVDKGLLRIEWRDFPYLGPESTLAAKAGRAAAAQGEFWAFHDALYEDQPAPNSGEVTEDHLLAVADDVGLDTERFRRDLRSEATAAAVERDFVEGQSIGVTGTPAFLVNGRPVMGAQPVDVFRQLIEQAAAEAR